MANCPSCGHELIHCEWPRCRDFAEFEGWVGSGGGLMRRLKLCPEHVKETYAYKKNGEKAFAIAAAEADKKEE